MPYPKIAEPKAMEKKSKEIASKPSKPTVKKPSLDELIEAQATSGFWPLSSKALLDRFSDSGDAFSFDSSKIGRTIQALQAKGDIVTTLVALYILSEFFEDQEDEWTLVAKKAKNWLKQQGIERPENLLKDITF